MDLMRYTSKTTFCSSKNEGTNIDNMTQRAQAFRFEFSISLGTQGNPGYKIINNHKAEAKVQITINQKQGIS